MSARDKRSRVRVENFVSLQMPILEQLQHRRRSHQLFCNDTMKSYKPQSEETKEQAYNVGHIKFFVMTQEGSRIHVPLKELYD